MGLESLADRWPGAPKGGAQVQYLIQDSKEAKRVEKNAQRLRFFGNCEKRGDRNQNR